MAVGEASRSRRDKPAGRSHIKALDAGEIQAGAAEVRQARFENGPGRLLFARIWIVMAADPTARPVPGMARAP